MRHERRSSHRNKQVVLQSIVTVRRISQAYVLRLNYAKRDGGPNVRIKPGITWFRSQINCKRYLILAHELPIGDNSHLNKNF